MTLYGIIQAAKEELQERFSTDEPYPEDVVAEIADGSVPIYNNDLITCAYHDMSLAVDEPECGPAFDGTPTPCNIIAANIYERVSNELYQMLYTLQEKSEMEVA